MMIFFKSRLLFLYLPKYPMPGFRQNLGEKWGRCWSISFARSPQPPISLLLVKFLPAKKGAVKANPRAHSTPRSSLVGVSFGNEFFFWQRVHREDVDRV
jgi:hypothetical protein